MKTKRYSIALNLPSVVALLIIFGRLVVQKMTGNLWFFNPDPPLPSVTAHLDKLEVSEAKAKDGGMGAAAARDLDRKVVEDDLKGLAAFVYKIVCQNMGQASAIIASAGLAEVQHTPYLKPLLAAYPGANVTQIRVEAKAAKRGSAYEWQVSTDGGTTWVGMGTTTVANTTFLGAVAGTTYFFRFRATRGKKTGDWSESVRFTVH